MLVEEVLVVGVGVEEVEEVEEVAEPEVGESILRLGVSVVSILLVLCTR